MIVFALIYIALLVIIETITNRGFNIRVREPGRIATLYVPVNEGTPFSDTIFRGYLFCHCALSYASVSHENVLIDQIACR